MLPDLSVSEFIDLINQTFDIAYPSVNIVGELANFKVSKNKWIYFDLKDELSCLKFFGTVYSLPGPLEDGMMLKVMSRPNMHHAYGFSMQVMNLELVGEGSIRKAAELLQVKLTKEGLFDMAKKRPLPYPPAKIGLITSGQSAAYQDFIKIINNRWRGISISHIDVQVQGEVASPQIIRAIEEFNSHPDDVEVLVIIRGGGNPEDLAVFSSEAVTRAVAASKIPTLVAIGHEIDVSLAELAADRRASTPSHAAELLAPDRRVVMKNLAVSRKYLDNRASQSLQEVTTRLESVMTLLGDLSGGQLKSSLSDLKNSQRLLEAYNPNLVLKRGYAVIRKGNHVVRSSSQLVIKDLLDIELASGGASAIVKTIKESKV